MISGPGIQQVFGECSSGRQMADEGLRKAAQGLLSRRPSGGLCLVEGTRDKGGGEEFGCVPTAIKEQFPQRQTLKIALGWLHPCRPHPSDGCAGRSVQPSVSTGAWPAAQVTQTHGSVPCRGVEGWAGGTGREGTCWCRALSVVGRGSAMQGAMKKMRRMTGREGQVRSLDTGPGEVQKPSMQVPQDWASEVWRGTRKLASREAGTRASGQELVGSMLQTKGLQGCLLEGRQEF